MGAVVGMALGTVTCLAQVATESRIVANGTIMFTMTNDGEIGSWPYYNKSSQLEWYVNWPTRDMNRLAIDWIPSFEYPAGSKMQYLRGAFLCFGGILDGDTLVSTEIIATNQMRESTRRSNLPQFHTEAIADHQLYCCYTDTVVDVQLQRMDELDNRVHKPLGLEIHQTAMMWEGGYASKIVFINLWVVNVGKKVVDNPVIGLYVYPNAFHYDSYDLALAADNITGSLNTVAVDGNEWRDTIQTIWMSNHAGDPHSGRFDPLSVRGALGLRVLRYPPGGRLTYNWWCQFYLAQHVMRDGWGPHRPLHPNGGQPVIGRPKGDRNLYALMTNGEVDYDQVRTGIDFSSTGWSPPSTHQDVMRDIADGGELRVLVSTGPLPALAPGDSIPFTFALFPGKSFHPSPANFDVNFDYTNPDRFLTSLDYSDLVTNARWAAWYYDTPGLDTDGDGYRGEYHLINCSGLECDTMWHRGDGVPDWSGVNPPPPPEFTVTTQPHEVTLQWTGQESELSKDEFSDRRDFEGFRVYSSRSREEGTYSLLASWDQPDNYRRIAFNDSKANWEQISYPLSVSQWKSVLNDQSFDPLDHAKPSFLTAYRDSVIDTVRDVSGTILRIERKQRLSFWEPEGPNHGNSFEDGGRARNNLIRRVETRDTLLDGELLQYGIYELSLDNLTAAIPLWMTVTSFDHGDYIRSVEPQESEPNANCQFAFPQYSADVVVDSGLDVTVYPNPYKILFPDAQGNPTNYYAQGYEGYGQHKMNERERRIFFANLPDTALIRIYSLDGDLIREIHHPDRHLTRYSSIVGWDLISRNTQAVTSGIYIWRVDSRLGSQVGKIVIIK